MSLHYNQKYNNNSLLRNSLLVGLKILRHGATIYVHREGTSQPVICSPSSRWNPCLLALIRYTGPTGAPTLVLPPLSAARSCCCSCLYGQFGLRPFYLCEENVGKGIKLYSVHKCWQIQSTQAFDLVANEVRKLVLPSLGAMTSIATVACKPNKVNMAEMNTNFFASPHSSPLLSVKYAYTRLRVSRQRHNTRSRGEGG